MKDTPTPFRLLDDKPFTARHIVTALTEFKDENGFESWGFCTMAQAKLIGVRIVWGERYNYVRVEFQNGTSARYYNEDQFE